MAKGDIVPIDIETTGLNWYDHTAIEIAYMAPGWDEPKVIFPWEYTGPEDTFYPWGEAFDPKALEVNKFYERYPDGVERSSHAEIMEFLDVVKDSTLMGANVRFDARFIESTLGLGEEPWHHRLFDLQAYAAGIFHWPAPRGWGDVMAKVVEESDAYLGGGYESCPPAIVTMPDHSAANDTKSVKQAYEWLRWIAEANS